MGVKIRALVPRLADGGERDRLWAFCRRHWETAMPEMAIVEGYHDGEGPFNRSAAINRAAVGDWDVAVVLDADVVMDADRLRAGIAAAVETDGLVLPYDRRQMLSREGTRRILALEVCSGEWRRWVEMTEPRRVSGVVVVSRAIWEEVGGFDERFEGWGGEDEAFYFACRELAGTERLAGDVWHLHHAPSPFVDRRGATHREARQLTHRYERTRGAGAMRGLLAERRNAEQVVVVALTTGTRDTLDATLESAHETLSGPVGRRLLVVDGSAEVAAGVAEAHPTWEVERISGGDYSSAMRAAIDRALGCGQPWIFWLEDDFIFNGPVDLAEMQAIMDREPRLAQLALLRQPWFPHETAAGSVYAAKPGAYVQRDDFVEQTDHWTQNPMLVRRRTLAEHRWPKGPGSEKRFGEAVYANGAVTGYLGALDDPPRVTHTGETRAGSGY